MYTRIMENVESKDQYFVDASSSTGVTIILPNVGKVTLDKDGFVSLLNYLNGFDYTLALQERGYYYKKAKNPLGYFATVENTIVQVMTTLAAGRIPDVVFRTISTANGKIESEVALNSIVFGKVIDLAAKNGLVATREPIGKIEFVEKLPAETSAQRGVVYAFEKKYYILNDKEDALVEVTGTIKTVAEFPAIEAPGKAGVLYNLTDEQQVGNIRYKRGLYTYNATTNEYALQDLSISKVDKLPDFAKAKKNVIYILTKDMKNEAGEVVKAKGSKWTAGESDFAEETREIITTGKLNIKEVVDPNVKYIVNGVLNSYNALSKAFEKIGKVKSVKVLPDVTTIKVSTDTVYVLTEKDGDRAKGSKWRFDTTTKEFKDIDYVEASGASIIENPDDNF